MSLNFREVKEPEEFGVTDFIKAHIKPWAKLFGFEYDDDDLTPKNPEPILPQKQEGVCRTPTTEKMSQPKPSVYKGWENGKFVFEFSEPLFKNAINAKRLKDTKLLYGQINIYPLYIYSPLKVIPGNQSDDVFAYAANELDAVITMKDMDFTDNNHPLGYSYKYYCPFYLSFLKTQVIIMLVDRSFVVNASQKAENKPVEDFGVYCPYYEMAGYFHPAIKLDLDAIRTYAEKEQKDLKSLYMHILLELLAYAYQDPTNRVDEKGAFEKLYKPKEKDFSFSYNEEEAAAFVKKYLP